MYDLRIINGKVYQENQFHEVNVYIDNQVFSRITKDRLPAKETIDAQGNLIIPGIIDPHVHFALDLGHVVSRDDFKSGSTAGVYGGVTTFIDFLDPTDHAADLKKAYAKRRKQAEESLVDYAFHATLKNPRDDLEHYIQTMKTLNISTLKLFTTYSDSNRRTDDENIATLLRLQSRYEFLILAHVENDAMITLDPTYTHLDLPISRPSLSETSEALKLARLVDETRGEIYMVHTSSGETIEQLKSFFPSLLNTRFHIESCPQYFSFTSEMLTGENGHLYTFAPPLRSTSERKLLFKHIGDVATIGTDHCAFNKADKENKPLVKMPLGVGGIEQSFDIMFALFGESVIPKMTKNVAARMKLSNKGEIKEGFDADCFIYSLNPRTLFDTHNTTDYNIYTGINVAGKVITTIARGDIVMLDGQVKPRKGRCLHEIT